MRGLMEYRKQNMNRRMRVSRRLVHSNERQQRKFSSIRFRVYTFRFKEVLLYFKYRIEAFNADSAYIWPSQHKTSCEWSLGQ